MGPEDEEKIGTWEGILSSEQLATAEALKGELLAEPGEIDWLGDGLDESDVVLEPATDELVVLMPEPETGDLLLAQDQALPQDNGLYMMGKKATGRSAGRPRKGAPGKGRAKRLVDTASPQRPPRRGRGRARKNQGVLELLRPVVGDVLGAAAEVLTAMVFQEIRWAIADIRRALLHLPGRPRAIPTTIGRRRA